MKNFEQYFKLAEEYYNENGNLLIPLDYQINGVEVGRWIRYLRNFNYQCRLNNEEITKLNSINMVWSMEEYKWHENYNLMKEFFIQNGDFFIDDNCIYKDLRVDRWLSNQKIAHKKRKLSYDKIQKLELISFPWNSRRQKDIYKYREIINEYDDKLECFVNKYDNDFLKGVLIFLLDRELSEDELFDVLSDMKRFIGRTSYYIFMMFLAGISISKLSNIFYMNESEIERNRLLVYRDLINILKKKKLIKNKGYIKKI